jgi:Tfp pilus assembly protein PilF
MNLITRLFRKEVDEGVEEEIVMDPAEIENPETVVEYLRRAWMYRSRGQEDLAEEDFRKALSIDSQSVDANYGLGMSLKSQGKKEQAIEAFEGTIRLLDEGTEEDHNRAEMLHRLALGHINEMKTGDWDLEREIWRREL